VGLLEQTVMKKHPLQDSKSDKNIINNIATDNKQQQKGERPKDVFLTIL
jgi:hypothetical protein